MERRNFLKSSAIGTLGICLFPLSSFGRSSVNAGVKLDEIASHNQVRHGLLNPSQGAQIHFEPWFRKFKKEVFFKNGFEAGQDDLVRMTFELNGQAISINKLDKMVLVSTPESNSRHDLVETKKVSLFMDKKIECQVIYGKEIFQVKDFKEAYILSLDKSFLINDVSVDSGHIAKLETKTDMNYKEERNFALSGSSHLSTTLIITKRS